MAEALGGNRFVGDFGMPMLPGEPLSYSDGDYVRIAALELAAREIDRAGVPGAAAELGVYRGSFARHISAFFPTRRLYLFDTFTGFDQAELDADSGARAGDFSDTSAEAVLARLPHPENALIRGGLFPDTASGIDESFCFVSLDADLYAPTLAGLRFFWPLLSAGGYIFAHDYNNREYPGAARAVREFCAATGAGCVCLPDICGTAVLVKN